MTKLNAGFITPLPASDSGSASAWGSKRINPRPQSGLCLTWSGYPSNDDDDNASFTRINKQPPHIRNMLVAQRLHQSRYVVQKHSVLLVVKNEDSPSCRWR